MLARSALCVFYAQRLSLLDQHLVEIHILPWIEDHLITTNVELASSGRTDGLATESAATEVTWQTTALGGRPGPREEPSHTAGDQDARGGEKEREREVPEVHFHDEVGHPVYLAVTEASSHYDARVEAMGVGQDLGS